MYLNKGMMRAKITDNLISFVAVKRNDWILKVSVFKNRHIMVVAHHCYDYEKIHIRSFDDQNHAADFIEQLVLEE